MWHGTFLSLSLNNYVDFQISIYIIQIPPPIYFNCIKIFFVVILESNVIWTKGAKMFLGYEESEWSDIAKVYEHENEKKPKDIWDLKKWYESNYGASPQSHRRFFLKLMAAENIDAYYIIKMIYDVLKNNPDKNY